VSNERRWRCISSRHNWNIEFFEFLPAENKICRIAIKGILSWKKKKIKTSK